nr:SusC/RagA family TonB-linked outer membrane protein [Pedobacter panaciterrae]
MKKNILAIVLASLCLFFKTTAQDIKLKGRVTARSDNQALPGATVRIKATGTVALTDVNGQFSISTKQSEGTIIVSYTGYKPAEIKFNGQNPNQLEINLEETRSDLEELVVIGYGQTTRKLNTGSVSTISAKQIEQQPVTNVLSALSGRMPGVFVQTTNSLPGGNINIQIRGKGSIEAGTDPLYIIDGVPYEGNAPNANGDLQVNNNIAGAGSPLNNINPADIESITILKDADATSIYGSRGSNGVVLITTKNAKTGDARFDVNIKQGISKIADKPRLLNLSDYLLLRKEAYANDGLTPSSDPTSSTYAPDLTLWSQTEATDWIDYIYGNTARFSDVHGKIYGGKGNATFSVGGNYHYENSVLPGYTSYRRGGLTSNFRYRSENNRFSLLVSNQFSQQRNQLPNPANSTNFLMAPNYPLYLSGGTYNWYAGTNIDAEVNARSETKTDNSISNLNLSYGILSNLSFKINAGHTRTMYNQTLIFPTRALMPGAINYSNFGDNSTQTFIAEPQLEYALKLKSSSFLLLAGATYQTRINERKFIQASNYKLEKLMEDLGSAGNIDLRLSNVSHYKYASLFGRLTYNLMDTYLLNATMRRDGSSRFGPGNRYGNFGSLGAAWIFSNLYLVKEKLPFLSYGKLRASYGSTGNDQIGDYQYLSTYSSPGANIYQNIATIRPSRINNSDFHWETTRKTDVGIELSLFKERVNLTTDYYISRSKDQLVLYNIPQITGFGSYQANLPAVIENRGWEFSLSAQLIEHRKLKWSGSFNLTLPKNQLKSFQNFSNSSYAQLYELGYDITRIYGTKLLGIDPLTGKPQYAGQNGEISTIPYFNFTLGKTTPDYYGGFGNTLNYGNVELHIFTQFVKQQGRGGLQGIPGKSAFNNFKLVKNRWTPTNPNVTVPAASVLSNDFYYSYSAANIFDTSYLRLKNVSLSYTIQGRLLNTLKLQNMRLYAEGQNLLTIRDRDAAILDPESGTLSGFSGGRNFPPLRSFILGIQLTL